MRRVLVYGIMAALAAAAVFSFTPSLQQRFGQLRSDVTKIRGDTGDVMASANYQRYQARREAVARMQTDLRTVARAESAYMADSGRPTVNLPAEYWRGPSAGNVGPFLRIERDGFRAMITNTRFAMRCVIVAWFDTIANRYHPGNPDCRTETGEAWDAVLAAEAARRPVDAPPAPPRESEQPSTPQKHRDWGPINNTPPPIPWIVKNVCPGEYCSLGRWAACSTVTAYQEKRPTGAAFTIVRGEEFTALTGDVHVDRAGIVVFRDTVSNNADEANGVDSIQFIPADTLFLLNDQGEGYLNWWYRGRAAPGYEFWGDDPKVVLVRPSKSTWWVHVRNAAGREGWTQYDWRKMARDDRMDEISRCKQP